MSRLHMMAGATAPSADGADHVSAYVVLADGPKSRLFKIAGTKATTKVCELDPATTLDLKRFQQEVKADLEGFAAPRPADATWACETIRVHLRADLGV